jgi:hypothetical protein
MANLINLIQRITDYFITLWWSFTVHRSDTPDDRPSREDIEHDIAKLVEDIQRGNISVESMIDRVHQLNSSGIYLMPCLFHYGLAEKWDKFSSGNTRIIKCELNAMRIWTPIDEEYMAFRSLLRPNDYKTIYRLGYLPDGYLDVLGERLMDVSPIQYPERPDTRYLEKFIDRILIDHANK